MTDPLSAFGVRAQVSTDAELCGGFARKTGCREITIHHHMRPDGSRVCQIVGKYPLATAFVRLAHFVIPAPSCSLSKAEVSRRMAIFVGYHLRRVRYIADLSLGKAVVS